MKDEETLDPGPEGWAEVRTLGHRMVEDVVRYLQTARERKAWEKPPDDVRARFREPLPLEGDRPGALYDRVLRDVLPYPTGNVHPRFWGWVIGSGTPTTAFAELLAATMNSNVSGFDDAASLVESQVLEWLREVMGFPEGSGGLLVSGSSMANLVGLTVARNARAGFDVRRHGVAGSPARFVLYASSEVHSSNKKAVELLGLGREALRLLPVDAQYRLDLAALEAALAADRAEGHRPFCVIGNAGTVNTGATDDLEALARLCAREGLWLHVDGAFGAFARLSPDLRGHVAGIERADSLAFSLHKWGHVPYDTGCVLVRRAEDQKGAFALPADYLAVASGGVAAREEKFSDYGVQLSRGFRALKVWMHLKEHGVAKLGRLVRQNVEQALYLAGRIEEIGGLELMAPVPLNVVCFRYVEDGTTEPERDDVNRAILVRLHETGVAVPSYTVLGGRYVLRVAITNHRSRREDFELLLSEVVRFGREEVRARREQAAGASAGGGR